MLENNPCAKWGGEWPDSRIVLIYHFGDGGATVWHELLHTLGAVDCYGAHAHDCNRHNCIMRYGKSKESLGTWPFLCDHNIGIIKHRAG